MKLYRGVKTIPLDEVQENTYLKLPRKPLNSPQKLHEVADEWFEKTFGIRARSQTIFCTPDIKQALQFGKVVEIVPVFSDKSVCFIFSEEVHDFNEAIAEITDIEDSKKIKDWLESKNYTSLMEFSDIPHDFNGEIMLYCKLYRVIKK
ncbi:MULTISPECIES: hypothetical protein [Marinomonas]|uniref:Uncharacterized protein n=1 Tax=Marinomonas arctica TaxID=383750 RepID=A0A7H1J5D8_9GAMM|nr:MULTISPECIES: hypothetical protein [Marinomonas]MCS7486404.1 hypothetical protein [Marinomonas sp. BSi20414]QNT05704.1 hypothetical protein IBG28_18955 [Marinomonas arctica]GGN29304.1 hypothetical protein GCM10011350_21480 [Marinomonas arctica]